jgi:hypothetical protein
VAGKLWMYVVLIACTGNAFAASKEMQFECNELGPGASQTYLETFPVRSKYARRITVRIEASNRGSADQPKCHVRWTVAALSGGRTRVLLRHEDDPKFSINGAGVEGLSPDGSKLLMDFFTAEGDYTGHRPVVYDFLNARWRIRDVGDRVTRSLPHCDYFTMIDGVTNSGNVVLSVPKSIYVKEGCPDQGQWLLNMEADTITRLDKAHASLKTQSPR